MVLYGGDNSTIYLGSKPVSKNPFTGGFGLTVFSCCFESYLYQFSICQVIK